MSETSTAHTQVADHRLAADIIRACRLGMRGWACVRHGHIKHLRDTTRMAERRYIKAMGWR